MRANKNLDSDRTWATLRYYHRKSVTFFPLLLHAWVPYASQRRTKLGRFPPTSLLWRGRRWEEAGPLVYLSDRWLRSHPHIVVIERLPRKKLNPSFNAANPNLHESVYQEWRASSRTSASIDLSFQLITALNYYCSHWIEISLQCCSGLRIVLTHPREIIWRQSKLLAPAITLESFNVLLGVL